MAKANVAQSPALGINEVRLLVCADMSRDSLHQEAAKYADQGIAVMFFPNKESADVCLESMEAGHV